MCGKIVPLLSSGGKTMKYYAVRNGRKNGVYTNWSDCESQVKGHSGSQFKSFKTQAEANSYMNGGSSTNSNSQKFSSNSYKPSGSSESSKSHSSSHSYKPSNSYESSSHSLSSHGSSSRSSSRYSPYSTRSTTLSGESNHRPLLASGLILIDRPTNFNSSKPVEVYTDGASKNNQGAKQGKSAAGYGVYYGPNDPRNYSGRVSGEQTNNRGELQAINHALVNAAKDVKCGKAGHHKIITDSQYSIDSITKWSSNWEKNGWRTSNGAPVQNKDLIQACRKHIAEIQSYGGKVEFAKVKGHSGNHGNDMADKLAVDGCYKVD